MIQNHSTLKYQVEHLNKKLSSGAFIQKVQSTPTTFTFRARTPGSTQIIHLGRGKGVEGLWVDEIPPKKEYRIKDRFDDWLKNNLIGQKIVKLSVDNNYRMIIFDLESKSGMAIFAVFYKGRNLNFFFKNKDFIFRSWIGKKEANSKITQEGNSSYFEGIYDGATELEGEIKIGNIQSHYDTLITRKSTGRRKKLLQAKIKKIKKTHVFIEQAKDLQNELYGFNSEKTESALAGIGLKIKKRFDENEYQFKDRAFAKLKNLKKSAKFLLEKERKINLELSNLKEVIHLKKVNFPNWNEFKGRKLKNKSVVEFRIGETRGALGKNVKGNDFLRNQYGSKNDTWFHLENEKSCHVVIKEEFAFINNELAELIGSLIRDTMKKSSTELHLIYTSLSNIKGLKGKSGAVTISNPNYFKVLYNPKWKEIISLD
ncbi:MAG: hypothetical protein CME70_07015 [Halobacteriovorax sp.]|nr:hypothetical protein [Halobacteriovorax sp.]|tara:strand:+ start:439622 stop:440905 length:1284 start_codon:yes stop_codon:yes gene_type:complete